MADQESDENIEPEGPETEVSDHFDTSWAQAHDEMARRLPPETFRLYRAVASMLVALNFRLVADPSDSSLSARFQEHFPGDDGNIWATPHLLQSVFERYLSGTNFWLRYAVELEIAARLPAFEEAVIRFKLLAPRFVERPVPERARQYLSEAVSTFIFGFDPACIALCRSTFEQVAKIILVERGVYTEPYLRRERPSATATTLLERLKQSSESFSSYDAASRLIDRGNTVLHRNMYDTKILRQQASDSVSELVLVLSDLLS